MRFITGSIILSLSTFHESYKYKRNIITYFPFLFFKFKTLIIHQTSAGEGEKNYATQNYTKRTCHKALSYHNTLSN